VNAVTESCRTKTSSNPAGQAESSSAHAGDLPVRQFAVNEDGTGFVDSTIFRAMSNFVTNAFGLLGVTDTPDTGRDTDNPTAAAIDFPRLQLDHGVDMPGEIPFSQWKDGKPDWNLEWRGDGFEGTVFGVKGWELAD
jgi:hypothetical protein